jgi:hypothetical protein
MMNERIRELSKQAEIYALTLVDREDDYVEVFEQKFAELIVQECMDIISNQTTLDTNEDFREGFSHGCKLSWTDIRKHFGVKE